MVESLYIHIPFCSYKCPYCDFLSLVSSPLDKEEYLNLLVKEAELYRDIDNKIKTLYLGGGTPTLLSPEQIGKLIENLSSVFDFSEVEEITVECNPETYRYKEFKELISMGVNRLSIGVQSFTQKGLLALGREHSVEDSLKSFWSAREAGFENISLDLIYAYPGQEPADMDIELEYLEKLSPEHLSAYMLTPYEGTPLGLKILRRELSAPEEEVLGEIYERLWKGMLGLGYRRYELSNWAREGKECRHNLAYWTMKEFVGIGVSAWGFLGGVRYGNTKNILRYRDSVSQGKKPIETLSNSEPEEELMLKLRLKWGLDSTDRELIPEHLWGFFEEEDGRIGIREEFMLLSNEITVEVMLYNSHRKSMEVKDG